MLVVDNMTNLEMFAELVEDAPNVAARLEHARGKYRREILKRTRFPLVFKAEEYISPRKNHWFFIFRANSRKDAEVPVINYACVADSKNGHHAFMVAKYNDRVTILMFPPHFFHRYRERFLEADITLKGIDLIKYYFTRNKTFSPDESVEDKRVINTSCEDGVCLGEKINKNFIILKTFVTYEMLKGRQIDVHENLYDLLYENDN